MDAVAYIGKVCVSGGQDDRNDLVRWYEGDDLYFKLMLLVVVKIGVGGCSENLKAKKVFFFIDSLTYIY